MSNQRIPKIWTGEKEPEQKPMPMIRLGMCGDILAIEAVKEGGAHICYLCDLFRPKLWSGNAEGEIKRCGYATDWARWDSEGRFLGLAAGGEG